MQYIVELYRTDDLPSQQDYWALSRKYEGAGFSESGLDDELLGNFFRLFIKSDKPLNLDDLREEFPSISVVGLKPNSATPVESCPR